MRTHRVVAAIIALLFTPFLRAEEQNFTWNECLIYSRSHNAQIAAAKQKVESIQAEYSGAKGVTLPSVSADAGLNHSDNFEDEQSGKNSYSAGVSAKQQIYSSTFSQIEYYGLEVEKARVSYKSTSAEVRCSLRSSFVNLMYAQNLLTVTGEIAERRRQNARLVQLQYEGGRENRGNYLNAKASLSQAEYNLSSAKRSLSLCKREMAQLMGLTSDISVSIQGQFAVPAAETEPDFAELTALHFDLSKIEYDNALLKQQLTIAYLGYAPDIYATGALTTGSEIGGDATSGWSAGVQASVPIFDGFQRESKIKAAESNLREAAENLRNQKGASALAIESAWNDYVQALESVSVKKEYLAASQERAKINKSQYALGLVTYTNWASVEDELASATTQYASAVSEALITQAQWQKQKGVTIEDEE